MLAQPLQRVTAIRSLVGSTLRRPHQHHLPPTFLLPNRARSFNSTPPIIETTPLGPTSVETPFSSAPPSPTPTPSSSDLPSTVTSPPTATAQAQAQAQAQAPSPTTPHESIHTLLPLLQGQSAHYITLHIHARPYLVTTGDIIRLPFHMRDVVVGDVLRLTRASVLGSRDYTLKGAPYVDERLFECRARVVGVESEPLRVIEKTKRRQRRVKRIKSKMRFTVLRVAEVKVRGVEGLQSS